MSECCSPNVQPTHRSNCPQCATAGAEVSSRTISHHIQASWKWQNSAQQYYFCTSPSCDVVYFAENGVVVLKSQLRIRVACKERDEHSMLCYCFGITGEDLDENPSIRAFIVDQTRQGLCSCSTSNPSGRCCLKDM